MTAAAAHEQASGHPVIPPSASAPARAWYAVVVFCIAQVVSTIDRGMLALVVEPVRADLLISDLQIALLQGFAFAAFYVTAGLPLGLLADRFNRQRLLIAGIVIWSCATVGGGLARDFGHMFASRLFIGVGEAVLAPCAVTMISDLFPASRRGRPMSVYVFGTMIAYGLGSLVSGYVLQLAPQGAFDAIAPLRGLAPWRIAYILVGIAGLALVPLLLPLRDPRRTAAADSTDAASGHLRTTLAHFVERRRLFLPLYGSLALFALGASAASGWGAVLLVRCYGFVPAVAGKSLGTGQMLWAALGMLLASVLVDRVAHRAGAAGKIKLGALLSLSAIPSCLAGAADTGALAAGLLSSVMFATAVFGTSMLSVIPEITPVGARGLGVALYAFVMTMIGGSLGPVSVAYLTEHVYRAPTAVGRSMMIVGTIALLASTALALWAARVLRAETASGTSAPAPLPATPHH